MKNTLHERCKKISLPDMQKVVEGVMIADTQNMPITEEDVKKKEMIMNYNRAIQYVLVKIGRLNVDNVSMKGEE